MASTVVGIGNCQVQLMVDCASTALGLAPNYLHPSTFKANQQLLANALVEAAVVIANVGPIADDACDAARIAGRHDLPIIAAPKFHFLGFHPDVAFPCTAEGERPELPMGNANSAILLAAWRDSLTAEQALSLFRDEVYDALGYYEAFELAKDSLAEECQRARFDVRPFLPEWMKLAPFMYIPLHPKIEVLRDITLAQLQSFGLYDGSPLPSALDDELARNLVWPVFPEIGERLGIQGDYIFRPKNNGRSVRNDLQPMDLEVFIERTFSCWQRTPPVFSSFKRLGDSRYQGIRRFLKRKPSAREGNPYAKLPPTNWWSKAVAATPASEVDPVVRAKFTISREDRVATAGSCFAQHLARRLSASGFQYLVTERAPADCTDPVGLDYGVFTARFGNIYTVRQLVQLAARAYGGFVPAQDAWELASGGFVDPFRPRIGGKPFASLVELRTSREMHFAAVRDMFENADVFVFTLGLTEAWWSTEDQAVVPLSPQVLGAKVEPDAYAPKNFGVAEVIGDLERLLELFRKVNPNARVLLTVSPVPLIATFENDHVLAATTYSKSVLRAAAGEIAKANASVAYFPSYEIITGTFNRGRYFDDDLRTVTDAGVDHVMRSFLRHYAEVPGVPPPSEKHDRFRAEVDAAMDIICDEEEIERQKS